jgi:hypothetical protein
MSLICVLIPKIGRLSIGSDAETLVWGGKRGRNNQPGGGNLKYGLGGFEGEGYNLAFFFGGGRNCERIPSNIFFI